ncbi:dethiobiotin synthase, partial [Streptomyces sp. NPDC002996]
SAAPAGTSSSLCGAPPGTSCSSWTPRARWCAAQLGVVVGSWPGEPDLAARCNLADLPEAAGAPLLGVVPEGAGALTPVEFRGRATAWLAPGLGGRWDAEAFTAAVG